MMARLAGLLPWALVAFVGAAFVLPTGPAYALVFYATVLPLVLLGWREIARLHTAGWWWAAALIVWSGLTLLWGHDDGHRSARFAIDTAMTLVFVAAMATGLRTAPARRALAEMLIWAGAANAVFSVVIGLLVPQHTERLHGWGATSHPILGASVMLAAYLTALCRGLTEPRRRWAHLAAAVAMAGFVLMTESRGPLLAGAAATVLLCAAGPWRWRALATLAALAAGWRLLPGAMRHHQAAILVARGSSHRFEIWDRTLVLIGQRPLFGHGLAANLDLPGITFPHDLYLSVLFYSGAVGFVLFGGLLGWAVLALWRGRRAMDADRLWMTALGVSTLLGGLTDLGQITKGPGPLWFIFWLPVGLIIARAERPCPAAPAEGAAGPGSTLA